MTENPASKPSAGANHVVLTWLTRSLRQYPLLADVMRVMFALTQPRYTAGVVGVVFNDRDELLIAEHAFHPRNAWGLPGGWMGIRESPPVALARELREELELKVDILCPLIIENGYYSKSHLDIAFLCRAASDVGEISSELLSYKWMSLDALPRLLPFHVRAIEAARVIRERS